MTFCRDVSGGPADNHGFVYLIKAPASTMLAGAFTLKPSVICASGVPASIPLAVAFRRRS